jgi:hypothetical protein
VPNPTQPSAYQLAVNKVNAVRDDPEALDLMASLIGQSEEVQQELLRNPHFTEWHEATLNKGRLEGTSVGLVVLLASGERRSRLNGGRSRSQT